MTAHHTPMHPETRQLTRVMVVAGESSGELYGALLAETLIKRNPGLTVIGKGGSRMEAAGVKLVTGISSGFGLIESFKAFGEIRASFRAVVKALKAERPQALVLIDYPDFNIALAKRAKRLGIPILYYVSPQVWAWRRGRVKVLAQLVDRMAVLLPFEESIYKGAGVACEFVGHPVLDEITTVIDGTGFTQQDVGRQQLKIRMRGLLGLVPDQPVTAFLPGSRRHEVTTLLPMMIETMALLSNLDPKQQFVVARAPNLDESFFAGAKFPSECLLVQGRAIEALAAADCAVIASGTSTFQATLLKVPMVVVYKVSPLSYFIGKRIIKVNHISLANLLIERSLGAGQGPFVKELLQQEVTVTNVMAELQRIIDDDGYRRTLLCRMEEVSRLFQGKRPTERVADIVQEIALAS